MDQADLACQFRLDHLSSPLAQYRQCDPLALGCLCRLLILGYLVALPCLVAPKVPLFLGRHFHPVNITYLIIFVYLSTRKLRCNKNLYVYLQWDPATPLVPVVLLVLVVQRVHLVLALQGHLSGPYHPFLQLNRGSLEVLLDLLTPVNENHVYHIICIHTYQ